VFEPRSKSTRRNVFQTELALAFVDADAVVLAEVARLEQIAPAERLNPAQLLTDLKGLGKESAFFPDVDTIVEHLGQRAKGGDVICVFSNGGFGGIHDKLLQRLTRP
jgi:UDP-N-acetylmuramate: L-alanyl-gamma-D-glutamyl-meso-diaminopimelate ligase